MQKKRKGHVLLSWVLTGALAVGMLSGCSQKKNTGNEESSQEEIAQENGDELQGHNEDTNSNLGSWGRAMGAVLISINEGSPYYFGGYAASEANKKAAADILKKSWNITCRLELLEQIDYLLKTGSRKEYRQEAQEMNQLSKKKLDQAMKQLSGQLLIHYQLIQKNWENWDKRGLLAWDMCRVSHLVQWGYIAGYLDVEEAQAMIEPAAIKLKDNFDNWEDVIMNWLDGYALYASVDLEASDNDYEKRKQVYDSLVSKQEKKGTLFDDSLFRKDIVPLSGISYTSLVEEIKQEKKSEKKQQKTTKKKNKKEKLKETDSEENKE